jgi:hypothetical protein
MGVNNTNTNISSLVSNPGTLSVIKKSSPKTFGDQVLIAGSVTAVATVVLTNPLVKLEKQKLDLVAEGIKLDLDHQKSLYDLQVKHTPAKKVVNGQTQDIPAELNDKEYEAAVTAENTNYATSVKILNTKKEKNQKAINDYIKDPFAKQKEALKKRKTDRQKAKSKTKDEKTAARNKLLKAVKSNAKKTLVPIVSLLLTNAIAEVIAQNDTIKKLVDDTNNTISNANISGDPTQLQNAKLSRDNAIRIINNNEARINNIEQQIAQISIYIGVFEVILSILSSIPIPTSVPPGIGIPINVITKIIVLLEKANKIILELSAFLPAIVVSLEKAIGILENYKSQLLDINGHLENAGANTPNLSSLLGLGFGDLGTYKGFKLVLKEENNPKFVIEGNKRHYAVAINQDGIIVAQSDYSFTLDPNDLVEQLKLIIDQQNLQS